MSRKPAIREAEPSLVVSHGCDFFGQDRHPLKDIASLSPYLENTVSYLDRATVAPLVALLAEPESRTLPEAEATRLAEQLLKVAQNRRIKPGVAALARSLADAAGRAMADGESWTWTVEQSPAP
ncbi:DUF7739 domain-containing protein [Streptomyces sp. st77]|uniref:DUF7739 domain-containing protein n=1 Tax=Streptomyces sp. st77 TaxID=1828074 RepID=UPI000BFB8E71|nr:hypothetical protein [Streptomyces sp. st77]